LETNLLSTLESIRASIPYVLPELILSLGILLVVVTGLVTRNKKQWLNTVIASTTLLISLSYTIFYEDRYATPLTLFEGLIRSDFYSFFFKILFDVGAVLAVLMSVKNREEKSGKFHSEYVALILSATLGAHLLAMSINFIMVFISLELLSISSYVLAGYSFTQKGAEGSLKYFLFGSVASAIMLYGFSILFGITGTLDFSAAQFAEQLTLHTTPLVVVAGFMVLAGFLYKVGAAPMHSWVPDVYEASPMPIVAFFSTVPKLAGIAVLGKFTLAINLLGHNAFDWQLTLSILAMLTITVGNFSAVWQKNPKRMMAYSSIAQSGFLLIAIVCFSIAGTQALLFYSSVYLIANYAVFFCLQAFEKNGMTSIAAFAGTGKRLVFLSIALLIGLISLAGIPPTGGFTSKLFVFASLWSSYEQTGKEILLWLLVVGLLNTVVSLFYYLKMPYFAFLKNRPASLCSENTAFENFFSAVLVVLVLFLFIRPDVLMGWLNTINFVL
jgi:NADH-quinone oxidoreductase subunit N